MDLLCDNLALGEPRKRWRQRATPTQLAVLDARSDALTGNVSGISGMVQSFPATAAALLTACGSPAGWTDSDVSAIYLCDTASPLVDSLGLGPNLVASGSPLAQRDCPGIVSSSGLTSKLGVELLNSGQGFAAPAGSEAFGNPNGNTFSCLFVLRRGVNGMALAGSILNHVISTTDPGWYLRSTGNDSLGLIVKGASGAAVTVSPLAVSYDGWDCVAFYIDDSTTQVQAFHARGDTAAKAYSGSCSQLSARFAIGTIVAGWIANATQIAYLATFSKAITSAMRTAFWSFSSAGLGTTNAYTRSNIAQGRISSTRVFSTNADQVALGYSSALTAESGNSLGLGMVYANRTTFLTPNNFRVSSFTASNVTLTNVDSITGMRNARRVADSSGAAAGFALSVSTTLTGATNVAHTFAIWVQAVTGGGTNAVIKAYFSGDPGGDEELTVATLSGTVPATWGQSYGTVTPTGSAHTAVVLRVYPTDGVAASTGTVDIACACGSQTSYLPMLWLPATPYSEAFTYTPGHTLTNTGNALYSPARGRVRFTIAEFQGTDASTIFSFGAAADKGALVLDYDSGELRLRAWNNTPALVTTLTAGALSDALHEIDVRWNATAGTLSVKEGETVLGSYAGAAWTPGAVDVAPLYIGASSSANNAARAIISRFRIFDS